MGAATMSPDKTPDAPAFADRVAAVRRFNRFYTRRLGLLRRNYLGPFSLAEMRVLYEVAHRERPIASEIAHELDIDAGYLSRMLTTFEARGLLRRTTSATDARRSHLALTDHGKTVFEPLEQRGRQEVAAMLEEHSASDQARIVAAMATIESLLAGPTRQTQPYVLRPHRPGDMGWVVSAHGRVYAEEYGWDIVFEAFVAELVAAFLKNFDAARERGWIAEVDGAPAGSIFLMRHTADVAKLRLLIVEPRARGLGIGEALVAECIRFAREAGYRKITLWTQSILVAARRIYERAGFRLIASEPHASFGPSLTGETWELDLGP
jgi:DNA-binding MarR family transcriptional regulator/GNAT superfamily N-acetyltransferase